MKRIQSLPRQRIWKGLVIGFWGCYAIAGLIGIISLGTAFEGGVRNPEGSEVIVFHQGLLAGIWNWSWKIVAFLLLLAAFATINGGKNFQFRRSVMWKLFGLGLALWVLVILFAPTVYAGNWRVDETVKSVQGPDNKTYLFLRRSVLLSYEALGQVESNHWYGRTCRLCAARYMGWQDYHPRGVDILFPKPLQKKIEREKSWDRFIYPSETKWVVVLDPSRMGNACILAYDIDSQKGYSEYSDDPDDPTTTIHNLPPFVLIGPDTPIDSAHAYVQAFIEAASANKGNFGSAIPFPKPETLHAGLTHPNSEVRALSKHILAALPLVQDQTDLPDIVEIARDPKHPLHKWAIRSLGTSEKPEYFDAMVELLKNGDSTVKIEGIAQLRVRNDRRTRETLLDLFHDPDVTVRDAAYSALEYRIHSDDIELLMPLLKDNNPIVRKNAIKLLRKINDIDIVESLLPMLNDPDQDVRGAVIRSFSILKSPRTVAPLIAILNNPDMGGNDIHDSRNEAAYALGRIGDKLAIPELIKNMYLDYPTEQIPFSLRYRCIEALGEIGDVETIDFLTQLLRNPRGSTPSSARSAIRRIRKKNHLPANGPTPTTAK
jgi:HEAT repeat protein